MHARLDGLTGILKTTTELPHKVRQHDFVTTIWTSICHTLPSSAALCRQTRVNNVACAVKHPPVHPSRAFQSDLNTKTSLRSFPHHLRLNITFAPPPTTIFRLHLAIMAAAAVGGTLSALGLVLFGRFVSVDGNKSQSKFHFTSADVNEPKQPWVSNRVAQNILSYLHAAYPLILLVFFITVFTVRSIAVSNGQGTADDEAPPTGSPQLGPGGKPLPKKSPVRRDSSQDVLDFSRPRKLLFEWLSLAAALTFIGNAITVVVHALYARSEEWWCGQATVVSVMHFPTTFTYLTRSRSI